MDGYDAVIVGGGHNGLVAASYLARAGRSCLVLERRGQLGGAAVSAAAFAGVEARISRYSYLVSLLPRSIVAELGLDVGLARRRISSYTPDPRRGARSGLLVDPGDRARTRASFREVTGAASEHQAWEELYAATRRVAAAVFPTMTQPLRSRAQMRALVDDDAAWEAMFERPIAAALSAAFDDELAAGVALTDALIGTFAAASEPTLRQNRCFLYHVMGEQGQWLVPVGGMGALTAALERAATGAGAQLRTHAEVLALEPETTGAAVRFTDTSGAHTVLARRVLVNAAPCELDRLLGREAASPRPEGSQLKLNMLLSRLPRLRAPIAPEQAFAGTLHVNETVSQLERAYRQAAGGAIPSQPPCEAYCHSLTDPSVLGAALRAAGAHTLTVFVLHMPARLFGSDPYGARAAALAATLRSLEEVLAEPLEECLLRDADGRPCLEAHTPTDLEEELRMPGGHIFHRDLAWPFAEREHEVGTWGVETEHRSILLCCAGARRGGGVSGIPGRNAAMAALAG
jgi:phytoene dehydrogenase-like protein